MSDGEEQEGSATRKSVPDARGAAVPQSRQTGVEPDRVGGDLQSREGETPGGGDHVKAPPTDATRGG